MSCRFMDADWVDEFDGFLSRDVALESDILDIDEADERDCAKMQMQTCCEERPAQPASLFGDFREECSMCCICWEPFLNEKQIRLIFLEKKQVLVPFVLPCLHLGHLCCLKRLLAMRCTQKCCGRCAAPIPEQLFGTIL